jgi:signal peptidase II
MRDNGRAHSGREVGSASVRDDHGRSRKPNLTPWQLSAVVAIVVLAFDAVTKVWAQSALADGPFVVVENFFRFRLTYNTGAAFSMFSGGGPVLAVIAAGVIVMIVFVLKDASRMAEAIALGMVLGGSLGNLADRLFRGGGFLDGSVVDFIDFSFFATFNVADMGITLGVGLLLLVAFLPRS